jgi:serine/threonine protein kinase
MRHLSDIKPGQVIGRYEFLAPIAQGGMAAVWAARQRGSRGFSRVVAIKTMLPSISEDPRFERMFLDEAQIASRIRHEHVVEILDLGEENEILYLVMEWVDGESLSVLRRRAAQREGIPLRLAVRIVADVCAGLHAAHELGDDDGRPIGLVHRDVSPQNVLVGYDGNVKILDFGVAKVAGRTTDTTNIGHARGKPPYMAPEQALGKVIDRRADVFSLGIIFYQLLVGRHPFRGENDIATLHNIISDQAVVRPSEVLPTMTQAVEAIALRAIDRDPDQRFQTAQEFELALEAVLDTQLGRVRAEEIGRFMVETMGPAQEDRRSAIRDAIRLADSDEPTQLDVSLGSSTVPGVASRRLALDVGTAAGFGGEVASSPSATTPHRAAGQLPPVQLEHIHRAKDASAIVALRQRSMLMDGWWQVLLAMATGAVLAWLGSIWISRSPVHETSTRDSAQHVATASAVFAQTPEMEQNETLVPPASQSGDARDARRTFAPRRTPTSGNRSAAGGAVNQWNALPPVPSPGF